MRLRPWWLAAALACGEEPSPSGTGPEPSKAGTPEPDTPESEAPRRGPKVTVDRSKGTPVVTAFGVQLNEAEPPPDAWHWHDGDVMLGGGPRLPMVRVPAGTFTMGSTYSEWGHDDDETLHEVSVSEYWIAATEVTRGQWRAVMGSDPSSCYSGCTDEHPVTEVSWEDAVGFANALSGRLGLRECYRSEGSGWTWESGCYGVRLPTEAEWEKAARAGTSTAFSFGGQDGLCDNANGGTSWMRSCSDGHEGLAPVRSFPANAWGIYDMHGNAREWVWDWYGPYPSGFVVDPTGPADSVGDGRILRGGSYENDDRFLRSAFRDSIDPTIRSSNMGFRIARTEPVLR